jgi:hypothetical protein
MMKLDNLSDVSDLADRMDMLDAQMREARKDDARLIVRVETLSSTIESIALDCPAGKALQRAFVEYLEFWRADVVRQLNELGVEP